MAKARRTHQQRLVEGFTAIQREGQGVWDLELFDITDPQALLLSDHPRMPMLVRFCAEMVAKGVSAKPLCCLLCGQEFSLATNASPVFALILRAHLDRSSKAMTSGICAPCADQHPTLEALGAACMAYLREHVIADLRRIPLPSAPGRA